MCGGKRNCVVNPRGGVLYAAKEHVGGRISDVTCEGVSATSTPSDGGHRQDSFSNAKKNLKNDFKKKE